jgi:putative sterol carrier protein
MTVQEIFNEKVPARLADPTEGAKMREVDAVFQFELTGDEPGSWFIDLKAGTCDAGEHDDADCTVKMDSADFVDLYTGETQGAALFMSGKLQVEGNMGLALQLQNLMG